MGNKKVLIISYYWPPAGGSGVQRALKFVKYLPEMGWDPIVYTPSNGEMPEQDLSLMKDISPNLVKLTQPIFEPYTIYKLFTGKRLKDKINPNFFTQKKSGIKDKLAIWIRSNFFIPDARMWWIKPSISYLEKYLKDNKIDAVISTGPPHSMHLIALGIKEKLNIPWLADFRDPWTNIDFFKELTLTSWAEKKHKQLEKKVLTKANCVVSVGKTWAEELEVIAERKVVVINNGFDPSDFELSTPIPLDNNFSIVHLGMYSKGRNHEVLWKAVAELCAEDEGFKNEVKLKFYGKYDVSAIEYMQKYQLENQTEFFEYVPHSEIIKVQFASRVLYLSVNDTPNVKGIMTGKVFEYLAVKRPILCVGPEDGDAAEVLKNTGVGLISSFTDLSKLKENIKILYQQYKAGADVVNGSQIEQYSRKTQTAQLATLLERIQNEYV